MVKRFRTWLFVTCLLVAVLGPVVVAGINRLLDGHFQAPNTIQSLPTQVGDISQTACVPNPDAYALAELDTIDPGQDSDPLVSARMAELFAADQAVRQLPGEAEPAEIEDADAQRRIEVLGYILQGLIHSPRDLVYAAFIFQHGDCPAHYDFAHRLAKLAVDAGYDEARWIYAATLDRYLMSLGKPQKYGTQYTWEAGVYRLYEVDPATTDTQRAEYNIPPLGEALQETAGGGSGNVVRGRWLESWWLTLIGSGFAVLGALIALRDARANPPLGRSMLVLALLIYLLSMLGHVLQVVAIQSGEAEAQTRLWTSVNVVLIAVWLFCAVYLGWIRPWQLRWGATDEEVASPLPGDELVSQPTFNATRGITIWARAEEIWPWIVQMGTKRAGWYSYDWLDNLGRPSAVEIIPEFQRLQVGDLVPMSPNGTMGLWVKDFLPNQWMLWADQRGKTTWFWGLYPEQDNTTRLLTRVRIHYDWFSPTILFNLWLDIGDIIMMRKCMLGIKHRAEALACQSEEEINGNFRSYS